MAEVNNQEEAAGQQLGSSDAPEESPPADRTAGTEERAAEGAAARPQHGAIHAEPAVSQFKRRRFFVLRPGTLNQAIKDVESCVDKEVDGNILGVWLLAEVDHWNNEKERLAVITNHRLLIIKYDFVMLNCDQIQKIPLNIVDRICQGGFSFPKNSLLQRAGEGLRIHWDRLREPSFVSWWNPFATDLPYITFTSHPVKDLGDPFTSLCNIQSFCEQLKEAAEKAHAAKPVPGKANGVLVLNQTILIQAYLGVMSGLGNQNKLGYCMARGNIGY